MELEKPVFIIGCGRSGSTVFHRVLSKHSHVAWLSGICPRYPDEPSRNRIIMKAIDYPIVGNYKIIWQRNFVHGNFIISGNIIEF